MLKEKIIELYGKGALNKSAIGLRDGAEILEYFITKKPVKNALEIGTYKGMSAALMAQHCEKLYTIDLHQGRLERHNEVFKREELWDSLGLKNIELILVKDNVEKAGIIKELEFDFAFVDGAHDETVADDFAMVNKCHNVLFHDYSYHADKPNYVYNFINSIDFGDLEVKDIFAMWWFNV
jgi:predicted O-methyltransferase YrrM